MRFSRSASHCAIKLVKHVPSWEGTKHSSTRKFTEEMNFLTLNTFSFVPCCPVRRPHLLPVVQVGTRARCPAVLAQARQEYEHQKFFSESEIDYISSLQNSTVKHCVRLRLQRPYREMQQKVLLVGNVMITELLPTARIQTIFYVDDDALQYLKIENETRLVQVTAGVMAKITGLESVGLSTLAAEAVLPKPASFKSWQPGRMKRLLVLEGCQDPGNMGTLLRTALAFGWDGVYLLPGCADPFNEKAIRASRGASFKIPLEAGSVAEWLEICEAHALLKIAATSADVTTHPMRPCEDKQILKACSASLVLGSEGQGLSDAVLEQCNPVSIPMVGEMESLNVASAGAVLMCVLSESVDKLMSDLTQIMVGDCSKSS